MPTFSQLCLTPIDNSFNWVLEDSFSCQDEILGIIIVPKGFVTDLGSIPRVFWNLVPPDGPGVKAYVIHDWLYASQKLTREQSDDCLLRLLKACDVGYVSRYTIYWAVRTGGWAAWNADRRKYGLTTNTTRK